MSLGSAFDKVLKQEPPLKEFTDAAKGTRVKPRNPLAVQPPANVTRKITPKPVRQVYDISIDDADGNIYDVEWEGEAPPTQEQLRTLISASRKANGITRVSKGAEHVNLPEFVPAKPVKQEFTNKYSDVKPVDLEDTTSGASDWDLLGRVFKGPAGIGAKSGHEFEDYRKGVDELADRWTTRAKERGGKVGEALTLGAGHGKAAGEFLGGHFGGLVSGAATGTPDMFASAGKSTSGAELDLRDRVNLVVLAASAISPKMWMGGAAARLGVSTKALSTALGIGAADTVGTIIAKAKQKSAFNKLAKQADELFTRMDNDLTPAISMKMGGKHPVEDALDFVRTGKEPGAILNDVEGTPPAKAGAVPETPPPTGQALTTPKPSQPAGASQLGGGQTVTVYRGAADEQGHGGRFFTDSEKDAKAYADLSALRRYLDNNSEADDLVNEILADADADDITDLGLDQVRDILRINGFTVPEVAGGVVSRQVRLANPLDLRDMGSEIGSVRKTWGELHKRGLVDEAWDDLEPEYRDELIDTYKGKALYNIFEKEGIYEVAFRNGHDGVIIKDQGVHGKGGVHDTYVLRDPTAAVLPPGQTVTGAKAGTGTAADPPISAQGQGGGGEFEVSGPYTKSHNAFGTGPVSETQTTYVKHSDGRIAVIKRSGGARIKGKDGKPTAVPIKWSVESVTGHSAGGYGEWPNSGSFASLEEAIADAKRILTEDGGKPGTPAVSETGRSGQQVSPDLGETNRANPPQSTGIANAVQDAEAQAGQIPDSPRATGTKKGDAHSQGKAAVESGDIDPYELARDIAEGKRTFKDETEVGALIEGKRRLLQKVESLRKAVDQDHTPDAAQRYADAQDELAEYVQNVQAGKGKWADVGRALQEGTTLDEGSFEDVLAEYRMRTPDGKVSRKVEADLEKQVDDFNALQKRAEDAEAEVTRLKAEAGLSRASESVRRGTPGRRSVTQIQAEKQAARENIRKTVERALTGGPAGSGLGGLSDAFDAIPELAREIRKLIELHIEEFKVGKLDSDFYVSAKKLIRESLEDEEWEALGVDPKTLSDRDVNKVLAGYYDQTAKTRSGTLNMVAELKKQAQLLDQIEGALEGDVIRYGSAPGKPSKAVGDLRTKLNTLLKAIGEGPGADGARTRLRSILKDLEGQSAGKYRSVKDAPSVQAPDIAAIKAKIREVRKDMRLEDTLADLDEQLRTKNLRGPEKRVDTSTTAQKRLEMEVNLKRRQIQAKLKAAGQKQNIGVQWLKETSGVGRMIVLGSDFGVMLRQGLFGAFGSPKAYGRAIGNIGKGLRSDADLLAFEEALMKREHNGKLLEPTRRKAGLSRASVVGDVEEGQIAKVIDRLFGATLGRIPAFKGKVGFLGRGQQAFLNSIRTEMFDDFVKRYPDATENELKDWADYINSSFGRSATYGAKRTPTELAQIVLTSPRYEASRWEMVGNIMASPATAAKALKDKAARAKIINMGATAAGIYSTLKIAEAATGGELVFDPDSADFLKLRVGDTAYDLTAGISPRLRGALRGIAYFRDPEASTQYRKADGQPYKRNETLPKEILSTVTRPVSPSISGAIEEQTGYSLSGWREGEGDPKGWERLMPLIFQGFKQDYEAGGLKKALPNAAVEFLGGSAQRYDKPSSK